MRVIERESGAQTMAYKLARAIGVSAGFFALLAVVLIYMNNDQLRQADPMKNEKLIEMKASLTASTDDPVLIENIRELDRLTRQAYFSAEHFNQKGIVFLVGSLVVMVGALKFAGSLSKEDAYPDPTRPKRDIVAEAHTNRNTFAAGALLVGGFMFVTAVMWESPLDVEMPVLEGAEGEAMVAAATSEPEPEPEPEVPALPLPDPALMAKYWPSFLGNANGFTEGKTPPLDWEAEGALSWKSEIPLPGFGSPIVWEDQVFLPGGSKERREVYCYDAKTGAVNWTYVVSDLPDAPKTTPEVSGDTGFAAATMATEGNYVFAIFATGALVALDLQGKLVWSRQFGIPDNPYGHASSLVIGGDKLYVQFDHRSNAGLFALDLRDGSTRWETKRDLGASWATPLLVQHEGQEQLIVAAASALVSYSTEDGEQLWSVDCMHGAEVACTPTYANGLVFASADYASVVAVDLATQEVVWEHSDLTPGVSTGIVIGEYFVAGLSEGGIVCLNTKTGEEVWYEITDVGFYSSPVKMGENVYLLDREGMLHVFQVGAEFTAVAEPALGEEAMCTPAFIDGALFLRGPENLYRFGS